MGSDERTWCGRDSAGLGGCLGFGYVEGVCVVGAEGGAPEDGDKARPAEAEQAMSGGQRCTSSTRVHQALPSGGYRHRLEGGHWQGCLYLEDTFLDTREAE